MILSSNQASLATLPPLNYVLVMLFIHRLGWSLAIGHVEEFVSDTKALAHLALALVSSTIVCVLQALHLLDLKSPCSNSLMDFQPNIYVKLSLDCFS
jgi:hypothetical protein